MKCRVILLVLVSGLLLACDRADQQAAGMPEKPLQSPVLIPELPAEPASLKGTNTAASIKRNQINTQITPDMVKSIRFDALSDDEDSVYSDRPLNLSPVGSTRISITPKLFLKEELDLKQNYMDNIDGASVQVEMKFD